VKKFIRNLFTLTKELETANDTFQRSVIKQKTAQDTMADRTRVRVLDVQADMALDELEEMGKFNEK